MTNLNAAGTFTLGGRVVSRLGYGAMQLAGPGVFGRQGTATQARGTAQGGGERRQSHRHQRLLRPAHHQSADTRGAAPLSLAERRGRGDVDRRVAYAQSVALNFLISFQNAGELARAAQLSVGARGRRAATVSGRTRSNSSRIGMPCCPFIESVGFSLLASSTAPGRSTASRKPRR
jgi:hypothetical protein